MEKDMIESYLNEIEKEIREGRFISAHQNVKFLLKNIYGHNKKKDDCEHDWETFCEESGCYKKPCIHRGRLCRKCKVDQQDALAKTSESQRGKGQ